MFNSDCFEIATGSSPGTIDQRNRLHYLETFVEQVAGSVDGGAPGRRGVLDDRQRHRRVNGADDSAAGPVVFGLFADGERLDIAPQAGGGHGDRESDGVGTHRHAPYRHDLWFEHLQHRTAYVSGPKTIKGRLSGVDVPIGNPTAGQGERTIGAESIVDQVIDEGLTGHLTIVLVRAPESATRASV